MRDASKLIDRLSSVAVLMAAVAVGASALNRSPAPGGLPVGSPSMPAAPESAWAELLSSGMTIGAVDAPVKIVEFSDLECPYCRRFHANFETVKRQFGDQVSLVFLHFPLPMHRFAAMAARATECADQQGSAESFLRVAFSKQDSLGLKSWGSYSFEAEMRDTAQFARCVSSTESISRIDSGMAIGARIGINATPTVIVNGWRYSVPPDGPALIALVESLLIGTKPAGVSSVRTDK